MKSRTLKPLKGAKRSCRTLPGLGFSLGLHRFGRFPSDDLLQWHIRKHTAPNTGRIKTSQITGSFGNRHDYSPNRWQGFRWRHKWRFNLKVVHHDRFTVLLRSCFNPILRFLHRSLLPTLSELVVGFRAGRRPLLGR